VVLIVAAALLSAPAQAAVDGWANARCLDSTHLFVWDNITLSGRALLANSTIDCSPYECNNLSETCNNPYQMTPVQSDFSLYVYFFIFLSGVAALFFGAIRKHVILTLWATAMFTIIGMQSVALDAVFSGTFFAGFTTILIGLCWLLVAASLLMTLIGAVDYSKKRAAANRRKNTRV